MNMEGRTETEQHLRKSGAMATEFCMQSGRGEKIDIKAVAVSALISVSLPAAKQPLKSLCSVASDDKKRGRYLAAHLVSP